VNNLNSVLLEGNLCRDPELRYTPKGTAVCTLVVASNRSYKLDGERHEEVSFVEATTWGKLATVCAEHLGKGRGVRVVGRLKQERWEDGDGNPRAKIVVVAEHVEFQPQRRAGGSEQRDTAGTEQEEPAAELVS
jgi:single-strand DNA-binding protein